jgi:hypothetical protein
MSSEDKERLAETGDPFVVHAVRRITTSFGPAWALDIEHPVESGNMGTMMFQVHPNTPRDRLLEAMAAHLENEEEPVRCKLVRVRTRAGRTVYTLQEA